MITYKTILHDYLHRFEADPDRCPVCCGDKLTTDPKYGGKIRYHKGDNYPADVYECQACSVWDAYVEPDRLMVLRDQIVNELVETGLELDSAEGGNAADLQDRYTLLHDGIRQCIDLKALKTLFGLDFYTRFPRPRSTNDLYWVDLQEAGDRCPECGVGPEGPDLAGNQGHLFTCSKHPDHK
jgi:hypothetical protein